jgi:nondiscriminating glutamyl-tRNA synthetase
MIQTFDVHRLNPSGAIFDVVKLKWMNGQHLRLLPEAELWERVEPFLKKAKVVYPKDLELQKKCLRVFKPAMDLLTDAVGLFQLLLDEEFKVNEEGVEVLKWEASRPVLQTWIALLSDVSQNYLTEELFLKLQDQVKNQTGAKGKNLFQPLRVAVIGRPHGPDLKLLSPLIPISSLVKRAKMVTGVLP